MVTAGLVAVRNKSVKTSTRVGLDLFCSCAIPKSPHH
jgi:hypothetical protein